jgi:tetratricopeptide (TPR) repeat protein
MRSGSSSSLAARTDAETSYSGRMEDRLRPLWDFADLSGTEERLCAQLVEERDDAGRAEVLTQLARVEGLRGEFDACERLLEQAESLAGSSDVVRVRIDLERGRKLRSSGDTSAALPLFEAACERARASGQWFLAADAAHMAAIADEAAAVEWTERGLELAAAEPAAAYWAGPLLNNLGWHYYERGEYESALSAFERALAERERDPDRPAEVEIVRYAVGKTLRALGRADEAAPLLEQCIANSAPDSYFHKELAEIYKALGRSEEAKQQAELAARLRA